MSSLSTDPLNDPVPAKVCIDHDGHDGLYHLSIEVEGEVPFQIGLSRHAFEELLDVGCLVFLDLHSHVHTQVPVHPVANRMQNAHLN